jgi:hypothetical protein
MDTYDYSKISDYEKSLLPDDFKGSVYNLSYKWQSIIPYEDKSIKIMEIGAYHGANICSYMKTYAQHNMTEIHCVDPWFYYNEYDENTDKQPAKNYSLFLNNISKLNSIDINKVYIHRGISGNIVPTFQNESFDIIYIDGNHRKRYVLEDSVNCFNKIKKGGWLIFDDTHDPEVNEGIQSFLKIYTHYFDEIKLQNSQLFIKRNMS